MMNKVFTDNGWEDYTYWQTEDKKTLKKIYKIDDKNIYILSCRYHYNDK